MEMRILKEKEVPILERKRYDILVSHSGKETPSKESLKKELASFLKIKEDLVSIRHLYPKFGISESKAILHVYKTKEDKERFEKEKVIKKDGKEESKKQSAE